ncbi:MAG: TIGR03936 family radical SAM-associated protein [Lachnospiraceae bacterium]|nr:TIGR03936 family radical SAM-associated protein [Lachnospiraceae bacterium]
MNIRMRFAKTGNVKFIGHLDIMRYFQKAFRRAGVDMTYSKGYSPHPLLSFAAPLGVGITSEGEYLDLRVNTTESSKVMIDKINSVMSSGLRIVSYKLMPDDAKTAMSLISGADYLVFDKEDAENKIFTKNAEKFKEYLKQDEIIITKDSKSGPKDIDIKPYIYKTDISKDGLRMIVSQGSEVNIRPEFVLESFFKFAELDYNEYRYQIHRFDLFTGDKDNFVSLDTMGEDIN